MNFIAAQTLLKQNSISFIRRLVQPESLIRYALVAPFSFNQKIIEFTANNMFKQQLMQGDFDFLCDKKIQIEILDAKLDLVLSCENQKIICCSLNSSVTHADAKLSLNTSDAITLLLQEKDPDTLFFQRRLKISGNTELAHQLKNTLDTVDPESLPKLIKKLLSDYRDLLSE